MKSASSSESTTPEVVTPAEILHPPPSTPASPTTTASGSATPDLTNSNLSHSLPLRLLPEKPCLLPVETTAL